MKITHPITRRAAIKSLLKISGSLALSSISGLHFKAPGPAWAETVKEGFIIEGLGQKEGYSVKELTREVFKAAGGMAGFVSKGDVVAIKPNLSWARRPDLAATTNPEVMEALIELCYEAGAKKVRIVDNTIHDAGRCFAVTGAGSVAKKTGADLVYPRASLMKKMKIHGHRLDVWDVFVPLVEADKLINLPIAKDHGLSILTLGIKNWMGGVSGRRYALHQDIHQSIVDLAQFFKPTITLIDAINIITKNGPSGGSPSDVAIKNTLILSNDQVAADAAAARLFGYGPEELGFILLGSKWGLGTYDLEKLSRKQVIL
ncbi:MAG TPA: DUF362 domain-containing protein [Desulfatiglandales bacterium]|nr:DUF362 domain-containing protein [Desulfatiglandales bacterium]